MSTAGNEGPVTLTRVAAADVRRPRRAGLDPAVLAGAARIVEDVRERGAAAVREHAERLGDLAPGAPLWIERGACDAALAGLERETRAMLERTAGRIAAFAEAQRASLSECSLELAGGAAGHWLAPVERVGCYAPGGRFPLPSSVLMTALPARAAGAASVWLASPRPVPATLAAAALADVDGVLAVGGAQAIAALAFGIEGLEPVDFICGPGNEWVTAAKRAVFGEVGVDMLAGPSELAVLADGTAAPERVAADLLAQAEHDPRALAVLVTTDAGLIARVEGELTRQLAALPEPSAGVARAALAHGLAVLAGDPGEALAAVDRLAPEHLSIQARGASELARRARNYGAVFVGAEAAEVLGDYGAGPNHVLPTGGGGRFRGGLGVLDFLRVRTWLSMEPGARAAGVIEDAVALGRLEGLEAHARSAELRRGG